MKKEKVQKNKVPLMGVAVISFAFFAVFGLSLISGNQQDSGVGSSQASAEEPADINSDNAVDIVDLSILLSNWNTTDNLSDLNSDNIVDIVDLSILLSKWGSVTVPPTADTAYERGLAWYQQNTGVPTGMALTSTSGMTISTDGTVIDGKIINGDVTITASNVTIKNSLIKGQLFVNNGSNILIEHVEIDLTSKAVGAGTNKYGVAAWWNTTVRFSKIHGMSQGIAFSGYLTAEDNYIYGIRSNGVHSECILSNGDSSPGGGNSTVRRNWLNADDANAGGYISSAMSMYGDFGQIKNVVVDGNYFTGEGYLLYPGATKQKPYPWPYNVEVKNNTFDTTGYGPVYPSKLDPLSESLWKNNKLINGNTVPAPQGDA